MELRLTEKPNTLWFGCQLCSQFGYVACVLTFGSSILIAVQFSDQSGVKRWKVFNNNKKSSPTSPFRRHLTDHHALVWVQECKRLNILVPLQEQEIPEQISDTTNAEPFTREGLSRRLVDFVSDDDQVRSSQPLLDDS
jgi:hypothetical protein